MAKLENYLIKNDFLSNKINILSDHTGLVQQIIKLTDKQIGDIKTFIGLSASKPIEALPQFIFI